MKKVIFILTAIVLVTSCDEKGITNEQSVALDQLKLICSMDSNTLSANFETECLTINPFNLVGDQVNESLNEMEKLFLAEQVKNKDLSITLINLIESKLPPELTRLSDAGYSEIESEFYTFISSSILNDDISSLNLRISCIEDLIIEYDCFNLEARKRLLVYCSVVKGISNFFYQLSIERKPETWDDCFRRKQQEMLDSGFIAKMACVVNWPVCFGIMAADCAIEQIN